MMPSDAVPDALSERADIESQLRPFSTDLAFLNEQVRLLEAVIDNFPGGISVYDRDLRMVLCNEQQKRLLDYPDDLFAGGYPTLEDIYRFNAMRGEYGPGNVEEQVRLRMDLARQRRAHVFERTRPNGTILEIRGVPLAGGGFVTTYLDVTDQRKSQAMIAHMAHHDHLTGLPNRLLFRDRLEQSVARVRRSEHMAIHYLDLDRFKPVNDEFGHAVGDQLLAAVAARLSSAKRETDTVARLGGDEFAIIQAGIKRDIDAATMASRVIKAITAPYTIVGIPITIGVSIGIALAPRHGNTAEELLRNADFALYRSKTLGRGRYHFFDLAADSPPPRPEEEAA
ncbi:MAG TPA: diguanylate cyclase [Bauldia sp.]|nr:diguanylate cyclase [Bauldia sp.]